MKPTLAIITTLLGAAVATEDTDDKPSTEKSEAFQIAHFSADVRKDNTTTYAFDLFYHPGVATAHCNASSSTSEVDCTGNLCVSYGSCGFPVNGSSTPVQFSISPDSDGTGLVVSIQSAYPQDAKLCDKCSKSGLGKLEKSVEWQEGVQVYTGDANFDVEAVLTVYDK